MPETQIDQPKFLTNKVADTSAKYVMKTIHDSILWEKLLEGRKNCCITVLVPSMRADERTGWPIFSTQPLCILEHRVEVSPWQHPYNEIAQCKALQLWQDRNDGGTSTFPHLLLCGDTPWWGGVKREGIVVACSGFQCHFDRMISGMIADMCIALAHDAFMQQKSTSGDVDFLT